MTENEISKVIVGAAIEVHRTLGGPGLLEGVRFAHRRLRLTVYEEALAYELLLRGLRVSRQVEVPITYKGALLASPLRLDLLVNDLVIVDCKAVTNYNPIFESQVLTYLRLTDKRLGLVINFGERQVVDGIHRVVNNLCFDFIIPRKIKTTI